MRYYNILLLVLLLASSAFALEELVLSKDIVNYEFIGEKTFKLNETIIDYDVSIDYVVTKKYNCSLDNSYCDYVDVVMEVEIIIPIIDGSIYSVIEKESRTDILINDTLNIDLSYRTSSIKDGVLTIKDLSDGASWGDPRNNECWHPQIPCEQYNLLSVKKIYEVFR